MNVDTFDPTSSANVTASIVLLLGVACIASTSYAMGRNQGTHAYTRRTSLIPFIISGLGVVAAALYIFFAYD